MKYCSLALLLLQPAPAGVLARASPEPIDDRLVESRAVEKIEH